MCHFFLKKLYGPFLWMGFNCLKGTEPLRGSTLLFTKNVFHQYYATKQDAKPHILL